MGKAYSRALAAEGGCGKPKKDSDDYYMLTKEDFTAMKDELADDFVTLADEQLAVVRQLVAQLDDDRLDNQIQFQSYERDRLQQEPAKNAAIVNLSDEEPSLEQGPDRGKAETSQPESKQVEQPREEPPQQPPALAPSSPAPAAAPAFFSNPEEGWAVVDTNSPAITAIIKGRELLSTIVDGGSGVNVISLQTCNTLGIQEWEPCLFWLRMADTS